MMTFISLIAVVGAQSSDCVTTDILIPAPDASLQSIFVAFDSEPNIARQTGDQVSLLVSITAPDDLDLQNAVTDAIEDGEWVIDIDLGDLSPTIGETSPESVTIGAAGESVIGGDDFFDSSSYVAASVLAFFPLVWAQCGVTVSLSLIIPDDWAMEVSASGLQLSAPEVICGPGEVLTEDGSCADVDGCAEHTCGFDNACVDIQAPNTGFSCDCPAGYQDTDGFCIDANECLDNTHTCDSNAACTNTDGSYTCACNAGYSGDGESCSDRDECSENVHTCDSNAACTNTDGSYTCACTAGYSGDGQSCSDINACDDHTCSDGEITANGCVDRAAPSLLYDCDCPDGSFDNLGVCTDIDGCFENTCGDGGLSCSELGDSFTCTCRDGYSNEANHQICADIDECEATPCAHGTCSTPNVNSFVCDCSGTGFEGALCDSNIDDCFDGACLNGGACNDGVNSYTCTCATGFTGDNCETNIDDCASSPCTNGVCVDGINDYECDCSGTGYEGDLCESDVNECDNSPCGFGACLNTEGSFSCTCWEGYEFDTSGSCVDINSCEGNPCGQGTCADIQAPAVGYLCICNTGYTASDALDGPVTCIDTDMCAGSPCSPGGTCTDLPPPATGDSGYTCECDSGFELLSDPPGCLDSNGCDDNPCGEGGTCVDALPPSTRYSCSCDPGYALTSGGLSCEPFLLTYPPSWTCDEYGVCGSLACTTDGVCEFDTANDFHSEQGFRNWRYLCTDDGGDEHAMTPQNGFYLSDEDGECRFGEYSRNSLAPGGLTAIRRWIAPWDGMLSMNVSVANAAELYGIGACGATEAYIQHSANMFSTVLASNVNNCGDGAWEVSLTFHVLAGDRIDLGLRNQGDGNGDLSDIIAHFRLVADLVPTTYLCTVEGNCVFDTDADYVNTGQQGFRNWHYMFYQADGFTETLMEYDGVGDRVCHISDGWCCTQADLDRYCRYGNTGNSHLAAGEFTPIRRWWAPWDGIAQISGHVVNIHARNCGTTQPSIQQNRNILLQHVVACAQYSGGPDTNPKVQWDFDLTVPVSAGDYIDLVLDNYDGGGCDQSEFYAHIDLVPLEW
jgi:hypothetical protein